MLNILLLKIKNSGFFFVPNTLYHKKKIIIKGRVENIIKEPLIGYKCVSVNLGLIGNYNLRYRKNFFKMNFFYLKFNKLRDTSLLGFFSLNHFKVFKRNKSFLKKFLKFFFFSYYSFFFKKKLNKSFEHYFFSYFSKIFIYNTFINNLIKPGFMKNFITTKKKKQLFINFLESYFIYDFNKLFLIFFLRKKFKRSLWVHKYYFCDYLRIHKGGLRLNNIENLKNYWFLKCILREYRLRSKIGPKMDLTLFAFLRHNKIYHHFSKFKKKKKFNKRKKFKNYRISKKRIW